MTTHPTRRAAGAGLLVLLLAAGCAQEAARPKVSGKVTYNGQPLADKTLILWLDGSDGVSQSLPLGPDGSFSGEVPQPGKYKVVIAESMAVMEGNAKARKDGPKVAAKYKAAATTDATVTIDRGENQKAIDLKD
jgi:hypothetical protein